MSDNCGCNEPAPAQASAPVVLDSVVTCTDGALSGAGGKQGACSYHGGVSSEG